MWSYEIFFFFFPSGTKTNCTEDSAHFSQKPLLAMSIMSTFLGFEPNWTIFAFFCVYILYIIYHMKTI